MKHKYTKHEKLMRFRRRRWAIQLSAIRAAMAGENVRQYRIVGGNITIINEWDLAA